MFASVRDRGRRLSGSEVAGEVRWIFPAEMVWQGTSRQGFLERHGFGWHHRQRHHDAPRYSFVYRRCVDYTGRDDLLFADSVQHFLVHVCLAKRRFRHGNQRMRRKNCCPCVVVRRNCTIITVLKVLKVRALSPRKHKVLLPSHEHYLTPHKPIIHHFIRIHGRRKASIESLY